MIIKLETKLNPLDLFHMIAEEPFSFFLDSSLYHQDYGRYSIISASPFSVLEYKDDPSCMEKFQEKMSKFQIQKQTTHLPFTGGAVGYLSYDLGSYFEWIPSLAKDDLILPDLYFGLYDWAFVIDHKENIKYFVSPNLNPEKEKRDYEQRQSQIATFEKDRKSLFDREEKSEERVILKSNFTKEAYIKAIKRIQDYILSGDIYQVNLSQRFQGMTMRSAYDIYRELRQISPCPFGGILNFSKVQVISNSPERFLKIYRGIMETKPIKGTKPRGQTPEEDEYYRNELLSSEKDKAELLMIVDLERNDLGRVAEVGSVRVPHLFALEKYANVYHLVATVTGEMAKGKSVYDVLHATFPGGSITGAPKIRAMQIIEELEPTKRSVYTGSIGYIDFCGNVDFNIAIRTMIKTGELITFHVGGGITIDSNPEDEYQETMHKARSIIRTLRGICHDSTD